VTTLYKLTDKNGRTKGETQWGEGVTHSGTGEDGLCGEGFIHAYEDPLIAVLLNPIHADFKTPRLWEAEGEIALREGQLKCGCVSLTTVREIPLPEVTTEQRVRFAILCAKAVSRDAEWNKWADKWLRGEDRSKAGAARAARAADAAAAARAATWAAWAVEAAGAARRAARAAARAAEAGALAAEAGAGAAAVEALDLCALAKKAVES